MRSSGGACLHTQSTACITDEIAARVMVQVEEEFVSGKIPRQMLVPAMGTGNVFCKTLPLSRTGQGNGP